MEFCLGKVTIYLSKDGKGFDDVVDVEKIPSVETGSFKIRHFSVNQFNIKFFCQKVFINSHDNPPWLDFVNESLSSEEEVNFNTSSERGSGLLLINLGSRVCAAAFGTRGSSWIKKKQMESDFGIKVAMNLCGNEEVRQAKSAIRASTSQMIDRQLSRPSEVFDLGMSETELLQYISAHLNSNSNITLQGKDCLTVKALGSDKFTWDKLLDFISNSLLAYRSEDYKKWFPNYPNLTAVPEEKVSELDEELLKLIRSESYAKIHLSIPEFIPDDEFSFTYTNYPKKENNIISHIRVQDLKEEVKRNISDIKLADITKKYVYAYSHEEGQILHHRKWCIYDCLVAEIELKDDCYILTSGEWRKVDPDFYKQVSDFVENQIKVEAVDTRYHGLDIFCTSRKQNREELFNTKYCALNDNAILFDQAKLRIGTGNKNKEFCDIFEMSDDKKGNIIHVKKNGYSDSINYLFSQARFYCEFFLSDDVFLEDIRDFVQQSKHSKRDDVLEHIKEDISDVSGQDYNVKMWVLYDQRKSPPTLESLPLMAKYELKLTHDKLRKSLKYSDLSLGFIPTLYSRYSCKQKPPERD